MAFRRLAHLQSQNNAEKTTTELIAIAAIIPWLMWGALPGDVVPREENVALNILDAGRLEVAGIFTRDVAVRCGICGPFLL